MAHGGGEDGRARCCLSRGLEWLMALCRGVVMAAAPHPPPPERAGLGPLCHKRSCCSLLLPRLASPCAVLLLAPAASPRLASPRVCCRAGRRPYYKGLNLDGVGVKLDARGRVEVDSHFR